ncbi:MAG: hypothetical protein S4CHLAM6_05270 [Chlamydiae bacterium]|nr:hypothetical protein [Chlamydiota bacterium]
MKTQSPAIELASLEKSFAGESIEIDLQGCCRDLIGSEPHIREYLEQVLTMLELTAYGACHLVRNGTSAADMGYSMFQLTESFSVSAHFVDESSCAYIHIFSKKSYDWPKLVSFSQQFFESKKSKFNNNIRH